MLGPFRVPGVLTAVCALLGAVVACALAIAPGAAGAKSAPLSIHVAGNHFVNGSGSTIRLLGVDHPGTEYACQQGWSYSNGDNASDAAAIAAWDANAVRIPLNEDCWLGINSQPKYRPDSESQAAAKAGYQAAIKRYVGELKADGIYAIVDLHWSAPGGDTANGQRPMPDAHAVAFWTSVAKTFKNDPSVVFDAFNEPYSPAADWRDESAYPVSWRCWLHGGCKVTAGDDSSDPGPHPGTYTAVGMQTLVNTIRATGAAQPILLGGLSYANDLSGWLAHEPTDPGPKGHPGKYPQLAASFHNYQGEYYDTAARWNAVIAPLARKVPVVTGEFGENSCNSESDPVDDGWDKSYMDWADKHGVSYLAWGWFEATTPACNNYYLLNADGTPAAPNGVALNTHLLALGLAAGK